MTVEMLARSLGRLPESMVEEALHAGKARRSHLTPWLRAAACIAVAASLLFGIRFINSDGKYITAPSLLVMKAYAFEGDQPKEYTLEEGVDFYNTDSLTFHPVIINCVEGLPITFSFSGEGLTLNISVSDGHFVDGNIDITSDGKYVHKESKGTLGQQFTITNNRTIYWKHYNLDSEGKLGSFSELAYVDVILEQEGHIVGYAVIQIKQLSLETYGAYLLKSVYFPRIFGYYQNVPLEYVQQQIAKVK